MTPTNKEIKRVNLAAVYMARADERCRKELAELIKKRPDLTRDQCLRDVAARHLAP